MIQGEWHAANVLVLRIGDVEQLKTFFEKMGMSFVEEKHGKGPVHFACQRGDAVLEIYPPRKTSGQSPP